MAPHSNFINMFNSRSRGDTNMVIVSWLIDTHEHTFVSLHTSKHGKDFSITYRYAFAGIGLTSLLAAIYFEAFPISFSTNAKYNLFDPCKHMACIPLDEDTKVQLLCKLNAYCALEVGFKFDRMHTFLCTKFGKTQKGMLLSRSSFVVKSYFKLK